MRPKCTAMYSIYLSKTDLFREDFNIENKLGGVENFFYIRQSQEGNLVDCCDLRRINLATSRGVLSTRVPQHSHLSNSYLPSGQSWHRPISVSTLVSAHGASTSSSAPSPPTLPAGIKDGHSAGWLSGLLCPPTIPQYPASTIPSINKGVCYPLPLWSVTLWCTFVVNMCDWIHLTLSERKWEVIFCRAAFQRWIQIIVCRSDIWAYTSINALHLAQG